MHKPLKILDLFSGIGGFSLGLERTGGFETVAFCEIEEFPRRVLAKHWPHVPCYRDVRELTGAILAADGIAVDVICGGFPCQDISFAGKGAGLAGERSGLFYEVARLIGELGPSYVILENVGALLSRGLDAVLGTLASLGYDAEWHCIPASYVGAPHRRDRVWIVAHPNRSGLEKHGPRSAIVFERPGAPLADTEPGQAIVADADSARLEGRTQAGHLGGIGARFQQLIERRAHSVGATWRIEPDVGRVANGIPDRAHRLKALGNAIVPQIATLLGYAILNSLSRIPARKPGGVPSTSATGQHFSLAGSLPANGAGDSISAASAPSTCRQPHSLPASIDLSTGAGDSCGGVGPRDCPAAVLKDRT